MVDIDDDITHYHEPGILCPACGVDWPRKDPQPPSEPAPDSGVDGSHFGHIPAYVEGEPLPKKLVMPVMRELDRWNDGALKKEIDTYQMAMLCVRALLRAASDQR